MSKGILLILAAALAFACMNILAKELSSLHYMQVVFVRALGTFVFMLPYMLYRGIPVWGNSAPYLFARSILGLLSLSTFFFAIQRMPVGSAISIRYIGPIFGAALAAYFLKERINKWQWLAFAVAFAGVVVIKGFDLRIDPVGFVAILTSAVLIGGVFVLIKYLTGREHVLTIINHFMMVSLVCSSLFVRHWRVPTDNEWPAVVGIGVCGLIGQVCMTQAFKLEDASTLAPFKYMELVYALLIGYVVLGETHGLWPMVGMMMIIAGMVVHLSVKAATTSK